jgi:hypothetical protein
MQLFLAVRLIIGAFSSRSVFDVVKNQRQLKI